MFSFFNTNRYLHTTIQSYKNVVPKNIKGKGSSSTKWLTRQLNDPYIAKAKMLNYRCRSAFKLLEIDERYSIFTPGNVVIDCGAAPGSWTQVAVKCVNADSSLPDKPRGIVISIDKQQIFPIPGAVVMGNLDFMITHTQDKLKEILNGNHTDVIISDMAPNATGIKEMDNENIVTLCYAVLRLSLLINKKGGSLLVKMWQSGFTNKLQQDMEKFYNNVKIVKPNSSRSDSAEIFLLAKNFIGLNSM